MVLGEIIELIRAEANIQGLQEYTTTIAAIINQELSAYTGKSKYKELLTSFSFSFVDSEDNSIDLPADYQLFGSLTYNAANSDRTCQLASGTNIGFQTWVTGWPYYWSRFGSTLKVYPYSDSGAGDTLVLEYYKKVTLSLDTDEFPVPSLEKAVIQATMGRMLSMTDTRKAQMAKQEALKGYTDSRAEDAGN